MLKDCAAVVLLQNDEYWAGYALQSTLGYFPRYVIYDVGSTDKTPEVIDWFLGVAKTTGIDVFHRRLPDCVPAVQGTFRNSMIAETQTEWYYILDGDEVYNVDSMLTLTEDFQWLERAYKVRDEPKVIYGVVNRKEVGEKLIQAYNGNRTHHRVYHRTATWTGNHPGEVPLIPQRLVREYNFPNTTCYHFHNTLRSSKEDQAHKRIKRKSQHTYHPGELKEFELFKHLPILRKSIHPDLPISPVLKDLQECQ
jgi:hypothetical protein